jgi:DNA-binding NarL/FixJ family response regulator
LIKAALAASNLALRLGLAALLNSGQQTEVVAESASLPELLPLPQEARLLVLVVGDGPLPDLPRLLPGDGLAVLFLVEEGVDLSVLLSGLGGRAWGVLPLDVGADELQAAAQAVAEGLIVGAPALLAPEMARLLSARPAPEAQGELPHQALSEREVQVLQLLAQGLANKQIAAGLGISEHTVKFHVSSIYSKLGVASRTEAVRVGVRLGLVVL